MPVNSFKPLKLKPGGFQFFQEVPVDAPPARVWESLMNFDQWFRFSPSPEARKVTFEPQVGGQFKSVMPDGSSWLHMTVTYLEPGRMLRTEGPMGMSHLPLNNVFLFEVQPREGGSLLRFCQRSYGWLLPGMEKSYQGGWKQLLPNIKAMAESASTPAKKRKAPARAR